MYSTRVHVYTRASLTDIIARKIARVGQVGEDVLVGVGVGAVECQLNATYQCQLWVSRRTRCRLKSFDRAATSCHRDVTWRVACTAHNEPCLRHTSPYLISVRHSSQLTPPSLSSTPLISPFLAGQLLTATSCYFTLLLVTFLSSFDRCQQVRLNLNIAFRNY